VSALGEWLASREPEPPRALAEALGALAVAAEGPAEGRGLRDALAAAARERLESAMARPGRVRDSAFRLLEADALFTYASEAALETEDPARGLLAILAVAGR